MQRSIYDKTGIMKEQIKEIAEQVFKTLLLIGKGESNKKGDSRAFRILITIEINKELKPLLLVGDAHPDIEDGHCIAVLNPDKDIIKRVRAGRSYAGGLLKEIVKGKCDLMLQIWIDAYKENGTNIFNSYKPRTTKLPKFQVE